MTQITTIIALLLSLVLADATGVVIDPVQNSVSVDSTAPDKAGKVESPQTQAGGGEGGWPGF